MPIEKLPQPRLCVGGQRASCRAFLKDPPRMAHKPIVRVKLKLDQRRIRERAEIKRPESLSQAR